MHCKNLTYSSYSDNWIVATLFLTRKPVVTGRKLIVFFGCKFLSLQKIFVTTEDIANA